MKAKMYFCLCKNVTESQLEAAIESGCCTKSQIRNKLKVGTVCGKCLSSFNSFKLKKEGTMSYIVHENYTEALAAAKVSADHFIDKCRDLEDITSEENWMDYRERLDDISDEVYEGELAAGQPLEMLELPNVPDLPTNCVTDPDAWRY
jgi:bacterioferritin-associated ferredoxin